MIPWKCPLQCPRREAEVARNEVSTAKQLAQWLDGYLQYELQGESAVKVCQAAAKLRELSDKDWTELQHRMHSAEEAAEWAKAERDTLKAENERLCMELVEKDMLPARLRATITQQDELLNMHDAELERLRAALEESREALMWCSGSADFGAGGKAREGWLKICEPLLRRKALEQPDGDS